MIPVFELLSGVGQVEKIRQFSATPADQYCEFTTERHQTLDRAHLRWIARSSRLCIGELQRANVHSRHLMSRSVKSTCRASRTGDAEDTAARIACTQLDARILVHCAEGQPSLLLPERSASPWC